MNLGIMQPYFLPYIGYFSLINCTNKFILIDEVQFIRHGWIERNKVLKLNGETQYIKIPLKKHHQTTKIKDICINNAQNWQGKILAQLTHYKKRAAHYQNAIKILQEILDCPTENLVEFNLHSIKTVCKHLEIDTPLHIWSEMNVEIDKVNAPDEWALNITKATGYKSYYNPIGGMNFFNKEKYDRAGIELCFLEQKMNRYRQFSDEFQPSLSIIDVLMFNSAEKVKSLLNQYTLT